MSLARQERFEEALASYDRAIALKPDFAAAHAGCGAVLGKLGRHAAALASHARGVELEPEDAEFQASFCRAATVPSLDVRNLRTASVEQAVFACLAGRNVDYQALGRVVWAILRGKLELLGLDPEAHGFDFFRMHQLQPRALHDFCSDPLLLASLARITVGDSVTERSFTGIRSGLLRLVASDDAAPELRAAFEPLVFALAQQCFLNEYVWEVTEAEHALVRAIQARVGGAIAGGFTVERGPRDPRLL